DAQRRPGAGGCGAGGDEPASAWRALVVRGVCGFWRDGRGSRHVLLAQQGGLMASDGQWQFQIHDTATGRLLDRVHPASGSWTRRMSGEGSGSHVFKLSDADYDRATWRDLFETWERTLVVCWSYPGVLGPIYAGIITGTTYDPASGTVTVEHKGIRDLLD